MKKRANALNERVTTTLPHHGALYDCGENNGISHAHRSKTAYNRRSQRRLRRVKNGTVAPTNCSIVRECNKRRPIYASIQDYSRSTTKKSTYEEIIIKNTINGDPTSTRLFFALSPYISQSAVTIPNIGIELVLREPDYEAVVVTVEDEDKKRKCQRS